MYTYNSYFCSPLSKLHVATQVCATFTHKKNKYPNTQTLNMRDANDMIIFQIEYYQEN